MTDKIDRDDLLAFLDAAIQVAKEGRDRAAQANNDITAARMRGRIEAYEDVRAAIVPPAGLK